ncbi:MAG: ABC transporter ATP-binding protein [Bacteroidetes bacterium]|nr:ABC transporter ATP-binding protein [Bacteroidota bacterium]
MNFLSMAGNTILEVNNLTTIFRHENQVTRAVDDISFSLQPGETLGIVGESGSGKSVTALSILRLIPNPPGKITKGTILYDSTNRGEINLLTLPEKELRKIRGMEISMIFQEPMTSLNPVFTSGVQVAETILQHLHVSRKEAKEMVLQLFDEVKLPRPAEIFRSYPHQLSGGQKQRVMIAMAISCSPKILIADEPTTALDVTVQRTILDLLREIQEKHRMSILFITHDLGLLGGFAGRVMVMYKGKAVEQGSSIEIFRHPQHPYTKGLISCRPPLDVRLKKLPTVEDFTSGDNGKIGLIQEESSRLFSLQNIQSAEEREKIHREIYSKPPIMTVSNIKTWFPVSFSLFGKPLDFMKAVDDVSFDVYSGETLGIVGESGCGKTTLGRTILQLVHATSGKITYEGVNLGKMKAEQLRNLRKELQIIFQDPYSSLNPRINAGNAIMEPMIVHGLNGNSRQQKERTIELLEKVGLQPGHFDRYPHEFSGGQRQRICIARALAVGPKLIICDESVSALDVSIQAQVLNLLNDLKRNFGFTYLFISHDLSVVRFMSDRLIVMKSGKIEEIGEADAIYAIPGSVYTRELLSAIPKPFL